MSRGPFWRVFLFFLGSLECLVFGGWIYGWASLVFVFKQEEYFVNKCRDVESDGAPLNETSAGVTEYAGLMSPAAGTGDLLPGCDEQDAALQLVFTLAHFSLSAAAFPLGLLYDKKGTFVIRVLASVLVLLGCLLTALSAFVSHYLLYPGAICFAVGGLEIMIVNLQISNLFGRAKWVVVTFYAGCFDSSAFVSLVVKVVYEKYTVSIYVSFFFLAGATLIFTINTFFLLPKRATIPWPLPDGYYGNKGGSREPVHVYVKEITDPDERESELTNAGDKKVEQQNNNQNTPKTRTMPSVIELGNIVTATETAPSNTTGRISPQLKEQLTKDFPSLRACVVSVAFFMFYVWFSILQLDLVFFVGTLNPVLRRFANNDEAVVSQYTNAFAFIQLGGILCSPLSGLLLSRNKRRYPCRNEDKETDRLGKRGPHSDIKDAALVCAVCSTLCIALSVCSIVQILEVQYATMLLYLLGRSFLYSLAAVGPSLFFPAKYFGSIYGLLFVLSTAVSLLQYPLFIATQTVFDDDDFWVKIGLLGASTMTYSFPIYIFFYSKKKEKLYRKMTPS